MKRLALIVVSMMVTSLGSAAESNNDDLITKICSEGVPWTLPKVEGGFARSEVYLNLNGDREKTMRICHCTEDDDEGPVYIWVRAQDNSAAAPSENELENLAGYYNQGSSFISLLKGRGCLDARGRSIVIHHADKDYGRWGTYLSPTE